MCGRYGLNKTNKLKARYGLESDLEDYEGSYNIAPSQMAPIISEEDSTHAQLAQFGFPAPWDDKHLLINAQSETVDEKRTFKKLFEERRCLIPANFFFEWKRTDDGKEPYAFSLKDDEIFSFAGIHNDDGFVILTGKPNELMKGIHDRHPIILKREVEKDWLNPDLTVDQLQDLIKTFPANEMRRWPVSTLVNKPSNNFEEILKPLS